MVHKWTTVKPVIGKIIRDIRHIDGSYFDDLTEWVAEAIDKMKTTYQLELKCSIVHLDFHHARLPCTLESVAVVIYKGERLRISGGTAGLHPSNGYRSSSRTDFSSEPWMDPSIGAFNDLPNSKSFYRLNYNKIESDIEHGDLTIWHWSVPTDEDGFPMIPNNGDYKEAIYFYCRMKMIGTGFPDPVFKYESCEQRWDLYAGRAIAAITYPTPDQTQRNIQTNVRLIPTDYLWESAGAGPEAEGTYY